EPGPEADEETEGERKEYAIAGPQPRGSQHEAPASSPPVPGLRGVEPVDRRTARAGRLVHAHIASEREGHIGAKGGVRSLIVAHPAVREERQLREVAPIANVLGALYANGPPRPCEVWIGRNERPGQAFELDPLMPAKRLGVECLQAPVVERRHERSLKRWIFPVAVFGSSDTNSIHRGYL